MNGTHLTYCRYAHVCFAFENNRCAQHRGVDDGPNPGQSGWIRSKSDHFLVDSREQWSVGRSKESVQEAMSPGRIVKLQTPSAKTCDALASYEIPDKAAEPVEELEKQDDDASNHLACGYCVCRLIPAERTFSATNLLDM